MMTTTITMIVFWITTCFLFIFSPFLLVSQDTCSHILTPEIVFLSIVDYNEMESLKLL